MVSPLTVGGDDLKAADGTTQFNYLNMGDVYGFNCMPNGKNFSCFIGGLGAGLTTTGYIGLYNFTNSVFTTKAVQSLQASGGLFAPACTALDEKKYYCLYSGTGTGSGCVSGLNNCNYSVWNNYQTHLNSGAYAAWPADTSWSYFSIAK